MTIALPPLEAADFTVATAAVNTWRGRCIAAFGRAEATVTEALMGLAERDSGIRLPHLAGERFATLEAALALIDDPAARTAGESLARFQRQFQLRTFLCHADTVITLDRRGRWQAVFTNVTFRAGRVERGLLVIAENQAKASRGSYGANSDC